jgi:hypothetical protein
MVNQFFTVNYIAVVVPKAKVRNTGVNVYGLEAFHNFTWQSKLLYFYKI